MSTQTTSNTSIGSGDGTGDRVFLRKASGLIKTASTTDVFIFNVGLVSVGIGIVGLRLYGPAVYPCGNLIVGVLIAAVAMGMIAWGIPTWAITILRSGCIY